MLRREPRRAVALMAKVARAVQYAHVQGILQSRSQTGNILLDGGGEPAGQDFGLAKWLQPNSDLTRTPSIFGTPGYIAPEQVNAQWKSYARGRCIPVWCGFVSPFNRPAAFTGEHGAEGDSAGK